MLNEIYKLIEKELNSFNQDLNTSLSSSIKDFEPILNYIFSAKGKQIRPTLAILASKILGEFNPQQSIFIQTIELIHNATLFHDDVIDNAKIRRNIPTLHEQFSTKLAILAGDYFLSVAIQNAHKLENPVINQKLSDTIKQICEGEIWQNLSLNKMLSMEEYLEKTKRKTALLFQLALEGTAILASNATKEQTLALKTFGENFGMMFQIKDDLKNFEQIENKPTLNDLNDGIITAPIIFLNTQNPIVETLITQKNYPEILKLLEKSNAINKTNELLQTYANKALNSLETLPNNPYKEALITLLSNFGNNRNN